MACLRQVFHLSYDPAAAVFNRLGYLKGFKHGSATLEDLRWGGMARRREPPAAGVRSDDGLFLELPYLLRIDLQEPAVDFLVVLARTLLLRSASVLDIM